MSVLTWHATYPPTTYIRLCSLVTTVTVANAWFLNHNFVLGFYKLVIITKIDFQVMHHDPSVTTYICNFFSETGTLLHILARMAAILNFYITGIRNFFLQTYMA